MIYIREKISFLTICNFADTIIFGNCIAMIVRLVEPSSSLEASAHGFAACWDTLLFGGCKRKKTF